METIRKAVEKSKTSGATERTVVSRQVLEDLKESINKIPWLSRVEVSEMQGVVGGADSFRISSSDEDWSVILEIEEEIRVRARVTDLFHYGEGWEENGARVHEVVLKFPASLSDNAISRRIKQELLITGMRKDDWCVSDFGPWRAGSIGAYADVLN